jgi:hypothetical protein
VGTKSTITLPESLASEGEAIGIYREPIVVGTTPVAVYSFTINSIQIVEPRSTFQDTDYVSLSVVVGNNPPITAPVQSMGNVGKGTFPVNLTIPNVAVGPNDAVSFTYAVVNSGYSSDIVEQAVEKAISVAAGKVGQLALKALLTGVTGGLGSLLSVVGAAAFGWLTGEALGFFFPDCDGTVAGADHAYTGTQLAQQTANGTAISVNDYHKGTGSPDLCGPTSEYYVTWSISTKPPDPGHGGAGGDGGGEGTGTDNRPPLHLD